MSKTFAQIVKGKKSEPRQEAPVKIEKKEAHLEIVRPAKEQSAPKKVQHTMTPDEIQELIKQRMAKLNQMKKDQQEFEALRNKKNSDLKKKIDEEKAQIEKKRAEQKALEEQIEKVRAEIATLEKEKQEKMNKISAQISEL